VPEAGVGPNGHFQVRIPGNRTVTLRAPRDGVVLRLE